MSIFNAKKIAKQQAEELLNQYNINYNKDKKSFSIHEKDDLNQTKIGTSQMVAADKKLNLSRTKKWTNIYFEEGAQKQDRDAIKAAADAKIAELERLKKELEDEKNKKGGPGTTPGSDIKPEVLTDAIDLKTNADNFDPTLNIVKPVTKLEKTTVTEPIVNKESTKMPSFISKDKVLEVTPNNPLKDIVSLVYPKINEPSLSDFTNAKINHKTHVVSYNDVYDVDENLLAFQKEKSNWSPKVSGEYHRDFEWSPERVSGTPGLIPGKPRQGVVEKLWDKYGPLKMKSREQAYQGRPTTLVEDLLPSLWKGKELIQAADFANKSKFVRGAQTLYTGESWIPSTTKALNGVTKTTPEILKALPSNSVKTIEQISRVPNAGLKAFRNYAYPAQKFNLPFAPGFKTGGKLIPRQ